MDSYNAQLCKPPCGSRKDLSNIDGEVGDEYASSITTFDGADSSKTNTADAITLNRLTSMAEGRPVDYVKMDIEGAEREAFREIRSGQHW